MDVSRRGFLGQVAVASVGSTVQPPGAGDPPAGHEVSLTVNGRRERLRLDPRTTLLDALRERLELTGTKKGCDRGQCGACTVHVDGRRVLSCLTLVAALDGSSVTTIEGVRHPVQEAFVECDALQCGFCTPGQVMSAVSVLREGKARSEAQIREAMSGNICRCGAYSGIVEAIRKAGS